MAQDPTRDPFLPISKATGSLCKKVRAVPSISGNSWSCLLPLPWTWDGLVFFLDAALGSALTLYSYSPKPNDAWAHAYLGEVSQLPVSQRRVHNGLKLQHFNEQDEKVKLEDCPFKN